MSVLILALVLGGEPGRSDKSIEGAPQRPYHVINAEMRKSVRQVATAKKSADRVQAIHSLARLHGEILKDARYSTSDTLKSYRAKIWSRLTRVKRKLVLEIEREQAKKPFANDVYTETQRASDALVSHLALVGQTMGGPAQVFNSSGAAGGRAVSDYGPELVDLIERTINPAFWDTNGGPGAIFYYAPLHALVVSATAEVHENIGGVLGGLRAAGN